MDLGMGPSVGLVIFYEGKNKFKNGKAIHWICIFFCQNSPNFLQGARIYFFAKLLLLSQLSRKMAAVQENMAGPAIMLFFSQYMPSSNG